LGGANPLRVHDGAERTPDPPELRSTEPVGIPADAPTVTVQRELAPTGTETGLHETTVDVETAAVAAVTATSVDALVTALMGSSGYPS
jgi:hypothetical protein